MSDVRKKLALRDRLLDHFVELAKERGKRQEVVATGSAEPELSWVLYERHGMLAEVNRIREELGYVRTTLGPLWAAERLCVGHVDYAEKWALYCAEIAMEEYP
ncbi:hypothetical protein C8D88_116111 [Lentzea atacamensis]|uniref:Uncharacterized protein n=1 Tax=Lentzea atacamensis TaxID=531938 RepID=A0A316HNE6_9PSEU|nr:hypothetical protein [Lentzea atacamensis]PWK81700.1 hypothetical protein C8D88_116111 [Lentzea atacamensis]